MALEITLKTSKELGMMEDRNDILSAVRYRESVEKEISKVKAKIDYILCSKGEVDAETEFDLRSLSHHILYVDDTIKQIKAQLTMNTKYEG